MPNMVVDGVRAVVCACTKQLSIDRWRVIDGGPLSGENEDDQAASTQEK